MKKLALGLMAAAVITAAPPAQAASSITVAVDTAFARTAIELVSAFQYAYPTSGYSVVVTTSDSGTLEAEIAAGGSPYDLFLAGSKKEPDDLVANYPSLVVGTPFKYAKDFLTLYSTTVDIHKGLPKHLTTNFIVPDPVADAYGRASADLLESYPWNITTIPSGYVVVAPDADTSLAAVENGAFPYGFIANSAVCALDANGERVYPAGSYHHLYKPHDDFDGHLYDKLVLKGVKIAKTRTTDQETELTNFIAFLSGAADASGAVKTAGADLIKGHCFKIPANP
jgi:molybdate transport system substrate-binding protein